MAFAPTMYGPSPYKPKRPYRFAPPPPGNTRAEREKRARKAAVRILRRTQQVLIARGRTVNVETRPDGTVCAIGAFGAAKTAIRDRLPRNDTTKWTAYNDGLLIAQRALRQIADEVYEKSAYEKVNDFVHVEYVTTADGGHVRVTTPETDEEVLEDLDIAIGLIEAGRVEFHLTPSGQVW